MNIDEIIEFCADEDNIQITFDNSVFWILQACASHFFCFVQKVIWSWDYDIDKYLTGDVASYECAGNMYAISIRFNVDTKSFVVSN